MNIRKQLEIWEQGRLSEYASLSSMSKGRKKEEEPCSMRTAYQRDRDRILHSKSFRRLKHKTQVFLAPEGDHYRTRLTHTLEVSQIARSIARSLRLNEDLTEAIALGHDLGHTPFGHAGERALNDVCQYGFKHNEQSVRVVELLEKDGKGLNLTWEVIDGILNHGTNYMPSTLEGKVVRISDKIAYINHDIDDAIRGRILDENDIPKEFTDVLGTSVKQRLDTMIRDIVESSFDKPDILMSEQVQNAMTGIRRFMFGHVYKDNIAKQEEAKARIMLQELYKFYLEKIDYLPEEYSRLIKTGEPPEKVVCDYIAGMSDGYSVKCFEELFVPKAWKI
ncbi:MAG: deoxyguanosinetriphosphate triphosphohydrolase [Lachnospiraceae bacterium]|nr:deoxyguanosinetriphosphate triphosphohydrolase [Lachnospiraceae bacterium]